LWAQLVGEADLQDVFRVGLDCVKPNRRAIITAITSGAPLEGLMANTTLERELEELVELRVLQKGDNRHERLWGGSYWSCSTTIVRS
jgi:hypothetical protein